MRRGEVVHRSDWTPVHPVLGVLQQNRYGAGDRSHRSVVNGRRSMSEGRHSSICTVRTADEGPLVCVSLRPDGQQRGRGACWWCTCVLPHACVRGRTPTSPRTGGGSFRASSRTRTPSVGFRPRATSLLPSFGPPDGGSVIVSTLRSKSFCVTDVGRDSRPDRRRRTVPCGPGDPVVPVVSFRLPGRSPTRTVDPVLWSTSVTTPT